MHKSILLAMTASFLATSALAAPVFNRIASFPVELNVTEGATSAEIIAASDDGMTLVYSDSPGGGIGFVDISDARAPRAAGYVKLEGEPTSVTVIGDKVFAAVNTRKDFVEVSGQLLVIDLKSHAVEQTIELGGQPDSIAHNEAGTLLAIAIENERNEEINDAALPQAPAGYLVLVNVAGGKVDEASLRKVDLTGLDGLVEPTDPEPEFVTINGLDEVAVTLQENNAIVIVDGRAGAVINSFSAGTTSLAGIDTKKDGALTFTGKMDDVPREPDGIQWLDDNRLFVANEGDWNGGARGFTIFDKTGKLLYENGAGLEREAARMGHYPDARNKKGIEPEGAETGTFGEDRLFFIAEERSSLIAVLKDTGGEPEYLQSLPSGISPEGIAAIPSRNLLATANEVDMREDGLIGSHVMIYERAEGEASYPQIVSGDDADGNPIGWAALSGAVADADRPGTLYAVSDSVLSIAPAIYEIDATQKPAKIVKRTIVTRGGDAAQKIALEGITQDGAGGFWLANEGDSAKLVPHALIHVDADGKVIGEVGFPVGLLAGQTRFGAEGVARVGNVLWVAVQREWGDDEKGFAKLLAYDLDTKEWGAVRYPLEQAPEGGWVGLSEITVHGDHAYIIERDNQIGGKAGLKAIYRVALSQLVAAKLGGDLPVVAKELVRDLIPDLKAQNGYVVDKVESLAIAADGTAWVITDNDGVADSSGETFFWSFKVE